MEGDDAEDAILLLLDKVVLLSFSIDAVFVLWLDNATLFLFWKKTVKILLLNIY